MTAIVLRRPANESLSHRRPIAAGSQIRYLYNLGTTTLAPDLPVSAFKEPKVASSCARLGKPNPSTTSTKPACDALLLPGRLLLGRLIVGIVTSGMVGDINDVDNLWNRILNRRGDTL